MKTKRVVFIVIILVLTALFYVVRTQSLSVSTAQKIQSSKNNTYTNSKYTFSFQYPKTLVAKAYTDEIISLVKKGNEASGVVDVKVFSSNPQFNSEKTYGEYLVGQIMLQCDADGPDASISCPKVQQTQPFTTSSGVSGTVYYLMQQTMNPVSRKVLNTSPKGPFYTIDISNQTPGKFTALVLEVPIYLPQNQINLPIIQSVVQSLTVQ